MSRKGCDRYGNRGLYFSVEPLSVMQMDDPITGERFDPLWELMEELQLPVFLVP